jgi:excisionase family DNA binding protein
MTTKKEYQNTDNISTKSNLREEVDDQYMTVDELALYIKRSKGAIRNLVLRRAIPYRKPAGRLLFSKKEIEKWIAMSPGQSLEEIENRI